MARAARFLKNGVCYYIRAEGHRGQLIFKADSDYERYIRLLKKYKVRYGVNIYGYCILPNEVHMIVHPSDSRRLSLFMQGINQSYAIFYNVCYCRNGKVWGQRYKSSLIYDDLGLVRHIKMVEFLPVQANKSSSPVEYAWSSCSFRVVGSGGMVDSMPPMVLV